MQPDVAAGAISRSPTRPSIRRLRVAAHHFDDVFKAMSEMARVSRDRVIVVDNLFLDDAAEEADRVRDPSHVKNWSEDEWRGFLASAGLQVDEVRRLEKPIEVEPWLERRARAKRPPSGSASLLGDRIQDGWITLDRLVIRVAQWLSSSTTTPSSSSRLTGREGLFHGVRNRDHDETSSPELRRGRAGSRAEASCSTRSPRLWRRLPRIRRWPWLRLRFATDAVYEAAAGRGHRDRDLHC